MSWLWTIIKIGLKLLGGLFESSAARQERLDKGKEKVNEGIEEKKPDDITQGFDRIRNA